ncbi:hypothetical protein HZH66_015398 [Vespula vulgaris]|uniref:Uncharacterized protein n=1 Tax=Vespula vulgaris TaxID=7454 RepID=A0A834IZ49_VESVU|nr:hypothetical protein HZH66_015398 [Vespula vulgaris]
MGCVREASPPPPNHHHHHYHHHHHQHNQQQQQQQPRGLGIGDFSSNSSVDPLPKDQTRDRSIMYHV